jgi:hypothetical protein
VFIAAPLSADAGREIISAIAALSQPPIYWTIVSIDMLGGDHRSRHDDAFV